MNITHEALSFKKSYYFEGSAIANKKILASV